MCVGDRFPRIHSELIGQLLKLEVKKRSGHPSENEMTADSSR